MKLSAHLFKVYGIQESKETSWSWRISGDLEGSFYSHEALPLRWDGFILSSLSIFPPCHKSGLATQIAVCFCSELFLCPLITTLMSLEPLTVNEVDSKVEWFPPCSRLFCLLKWTEQFVLAKIDNWFNRKSSSLFTNPTEISVTTIASVCLPACVKSGQKRHKTSACS